MIHVDDQQFAFLALQRGALSDLVGNRTRWQEAYEASLSATMASIEQDLPAWCASVLDIGGGMGGINILLARLWPDLNVTILDGEDDAPVMRRHRETFNNAAVARRFLEQNGVGHIDFFSPRLGEPRPFDLIVSFASWCFHYEPAVYLDFVRACCRPGTVLILDIRRDKPHWRPELEKAFALRRVALVAPKFERIVFDAR
jgi:SAM-dependent methyltransferase